MKSLPFSRLAAVVVFGALLALASYHSLAEDAKADDWIAPARAARRKNPITADDKSIATGKEVYLHQCLSCHGT